MPRFWTVEEARAALHEVVPLLLELQAIMARVRELGAASRPADAVPAPTVNGHGSSRGPAPAEYASEAQRILDRLRELGVQVKDINTGLIDFPYLRDGEEVLLCFRLGEPDIGYWHNLRSGFPGRRPLSEL